MAGQLPSKYNKQSSGASFRAEIRRELSADLQRMVEEQTVQLTNLRDVATTQAGVAITACLKAEEYLEEARAILGDIKAHQEHTKAYGDELVALSKKTGIQLASAKQLLAENRST